MTLFLTVSFLAVIALGTLPTSGLSGILERRPT